MSVSGYTGLKDEPTAERGANQARPPTPTWFWGEEFVGFTRGTTHDPVA
jgi:hypothetical protein